MNANVRLQEPFVMGNRKIYPVVFEETMILESGMVGSLAPLALIIEEDGRFSFALLAGESFLEILEKLVCPVL